MGGLDLAFYQRRSKYHTLDDSVDSLNNGDGGYASVWSMLENVWAVTGVLVNDEGDMLDQAPVYFDVFGKSMAVFTLKSFLVVNILLLILGPLSVAGCIYYLRQYQGYNQEHHSASWLSAKRGWARFPIALVVGLAVTIIFGAIYSASNPFAMQRCSTFLPFP